MRMPHASLTDVGQRREHNEDAVHAQPPVFVVADGVGGSAKGEVASHRAIEQFVQSAPPIVAARTAAEAVRAMEQAVLDANSAVHQAQLEDDSLRGMATTLVAMVVRDGGEITVGHVGDSRLYVISATGARMATQDHSVVAELVRSGRLHPDDAGQHPQRNVITRALGPEPDVSVDAFTMHVGPGDWLLACSDGLTEHVPDAQLAQLVLDHAADPELAVRQLIDHANAAGGSDNITAAIVQPVPSDVSGELRIEALQALAAASPAATTTQMSSAPAERSGPLRTIDAPAGMTAAETSGELPVLQPIGEAEQRTSARVIRHEQRMRRQRAVLVVAGLMLIAALAGGFIWSHSYFLIEREDGRVGINRGFPFARLATPHRSSDVLASELTAADRARLVNSHRILDREDAEQVLAELDDRIEPISGEEALDGVAADT